MNFQIKRISSCKPDQRKKATSWKYSSKPTSSKKSQADPLSQYCSQSSTMAWSSLQFKSVPKTMPAPIANSPIDNRAKTKNTLRSILLSGTSYVEHLRISSTSWCLFDENKEKFIGFRQRHQREIASLTKIMTTILSIEFSQYYQLNPQLHVKITQNSSKMIGTTADLKTNTWVKFKDLLYGAMLPSGNDAAYLLSQVVGYMYKFDGKNKVQFLRSVKFLDISNDNTTFYTIQFVKLMNKRAQQLGLTQTKFSNPHGLQNALNVSSPRDMLILSSYAVKNKLFRKIMNTQFHRYQFAQLIENKQISNQSQTQLLQKSNSRVHRNSHNKQTVKITRRFWQNTNVLLKKGWQGVKTGQTGPAGSCLSSVKNSIFIVVLNCKDNEARFSETQKIYNWYINKRNSQSTDDQETININKV